MIIGISGKAGSGKDTIGNIIQYILVQQDILKTQPTWEVDFGVAAYTKAGYEDWLLFGVGARYGNSSFVIKKFADKLKDIVCLLIDCTREDLEDSRFKETPIGKEWIVWYYTHYKLITNNSDGRISPYFSSKEEAMTYNFPKLSDTYLWGKDAEGVGIQTRILTPRLLMQLIGTEAGRNIIHPNIWVNALMNKYKEKFISGGIGMFHDPRPSYKSLGFPNWIITDVRFLNEVEAIKHNGLLIRVNRTVKEDTIPNHISELELDNYNDWNYVIENNSTIDNLITELRMILERERISITGKVL